MQIFIRRSFIKKKKNIELIIHWKSFKEIRDNKIFYIILLFLMNIIYEQKIIYKENYW